ncbi:MAG TPA: prolipoprotein diacylglyceryl transferase [Bauldia sp.]|nr:prolipoprotein diacylglyceryl transferase [Bauldia sp.]
MELLALPFPAIDPVLVTIGPLSIRWYALAYIAGIFLAWWYCKRLANNARLWGPAGAPMKGSDLDDFVVWAALGTVGGGRLGYILFYDLQHYLRDPADILAVWHGGMSFHGGFLGMMLAMTLFARRRHIPAWSLIDLVATAVPFGLFFGRLANFINGELWGRVTDVPWAMVFPNAGDLPRHPSQLYEAALEGIALFIVLRLATHRYHKLATPAYVSGVFCAGYGVTRTLAELFREPDVQIGYLFGGLTEGMLLSIPMILFGVALIVWSSRRKAAAT